MRVIDDLSPEQLDEFRSSMILKEKDVTFINKSGDFFGDHFPLTEQKLKRSFTLTTSRVKCLMMTKENLKLFMHKMYTSPEYTTKYNFLLDHIPIMNRLTRVTKDRITKAFKCVSYASGYSIFREGDYLKDAYLILQGEVEITSS